MKKRKKIILTVIIVITIIATILLLPIRPQNIKIRNNTKHYCSGDCGEGRQCIGEVAPVCGSDNTTYSNGCIACCTNKKLKWYTDGECGE